VAPCDDMMTETAEARKIEGRCGEDVRKVLEKFRSERKKLADCS